MNSRNRFTRVKYVHRHPRAQTRLVRYILNLESCGIGTLPHLINAYWRREQTRWSANRFESQRLDIWQPRGQRHRHVSIPPRRRSRKDTTRNLANEIQNPAHLVPFPSVCRSRRSSVPGRAVRATRSAVVEFKAGSKPLRWWMKKEDRKKDAESSFFFSIAFIRGSNEQFIAVVAAVICNSHIYLWAWHRSESLHFLVHTLHLWSVRYIDTPFTLTPDFATLKDLIFTMTQHLCTSTHLWHQIDFVHKLYRLGRSHVMGSKKKKLVTFLHTVLYLWNT